MESKKKRLSINVIAQIVTFAVQMLISLFLTPFIIKRLGADSYGYIGLTDSFVSYAQVIIIALNSMAGRFVTIAYHQNKIDEAKKIFSSVFYANVIITIIIFLVSLICVWRLEYLIVIPEKLIFDVKALFSLMFVNLMVSVSFSTYQVATFIKNRLELNAVRSVVSNIARVGILLLCFGLFAPHLWYIGLAAIVCTLYISFANIRYTRMLTPELNVNYTCFDISTIKMLISSGIWNSITKLGNILGQGLDLLFANLFINAIAMGYLSITERIPVIVLSLVSSICAVFAPTLTKLYAQGNIEGIQKELIFSIKFAGFISLFPLTFVFAFGDSFYRLWVPSEDASMLYILTILGTICNPVAMSLEGIQNIFTVTNKVKVYSMVALGCNLAMFLSLLIGLRFIPNEYKIYYLATVQSFWAFFRVAIFLPMYGAHCVNVSKYYFYPVMFKVLTTLVLAVVTMLLVKYYVKIENWIMLFVMLIIITFVCILYSTLIIFSSNERKKVLSMIIKKNN